jgi:hypothetical protein
MSGRLLTVAPFCAPDLIEIKVHAGQPEMACDRVRAGQAFEAAGGCYTFRHVIDGRIIFCCGVIPNHPGHGTLWSALSHDSGALMMAVTRRAADFIDTLSFRRLDALVRAEHEKGHKWMRILGFAQEAVLSDWFADGAGAILYRYKGDI